MVIASHRRALACLLATAALSLSACRDASRPEAPAAPSFSAAPGAAGRFVVVFRSDVPDAPGLARQLAAATGAELHFTYQHAIKGMAVTASDAGRDVIRRHPAVAYLEPDAEVRLFDVQANPPAWGLDRVDQRDLPLDLKYAYHNLGGAANVYVFDTGVRRTHTDFGGRVQFVPNGRNGDFVGDSYGTANGAEDCHGHGTHVAGTAAGSSYGIAKGAPVWAARVVNCSGGGQVSMAIAAVDWATANAQRPAVVNMSLGYGNVQSLRDAVEASVAAGVNYSVAAGNGNFAGIPQNACSESPAGAPNALTVGATRIDDTEASFSNYGPCVDLLAPGVSIKSDYYTSDAATATMSGTSMATPHVTGAVALYLTANPGATPAQVAAAITGNATAGRIALHRRSRGGGTPNLLLYTGFVGAEEPPPPPPPDPEPEPPPPEGFTLSATGYKVKGVQHADLTWAGASGGSVDVYRNGALIVTTENDGAHTDNIGAKGGGTYVYKVCEADNSTCSNEVSVAF